MTSGFVRFEDHCLWVLLLFYTNFLDIELYILASSFFLNDLFVGRHLNYYHYKILTESLKRMVRNNP